MEYDSNSTLITSSRSLRGLRDVHNSDHGHRSHMITESFALTKGKGTVYTFCEQFPICLAVLSPMSFKHVCFIQHHSDLDLIYLSCVSSFLISNLISLWPSNSIKFKSEMLPEPNLILCSGSVSSLDETRFETMIVHPSFH